MVYVIVSVYGARNLPSRKGDVICKVSIGKSSKRTNPANQIDGVCWNEQLQFKLDHLSDDRFTENSKVGADKQNIVLNVSLWEIGGLLSSNASCVGELEIKMGCEKFSNQPGVGPSYMAWRRIPNKDDVRYDDLWWCGPGHRLHGILQSLDDQEEQWLELYPPSASTSSIGLNSTNSIALGITNNLGLTGANRARSYEEGSIDGVRGEILIGIEVIDHVVDKIRRQQIYKFLNELLEISRKTLNISAGDALSRTQQSIPLQFENTFDFEPNTTVDPIALERLEGYENLMSNQPNNNNNNNNNNNSNNYNNTNTNTTAYSTEFSSSSDTGYTNVGTTNSSTTNTTTNANTNSTSQNTTNISILEMARRVKDIFPDVPIEKLQADLELTKSMQATTERVLEQKLGTPFGNNNNNNNPQNANSSQNNARSPPLSSFQTPTKSSSPPPSTTVSPRNNNSNTKNISNSYNNIPAQTPVKSPNVITSSLPNMNPPSRPTLPYSPSILSPPPTPSPVFRSVTPDSPTTPFFRTQESTEKQHLYFQSYSCEGNTSFYGPPPKTEPVKFFTLQSASPLVLPHSSKKPPLSTEKFVGYLSWNEENKKSPVLQSDGTSKENALNSRFQRLVETIRGFKDESDFSEKIEVNNELIRLSQDFVSNATSYGKIIISEVNLPPSQKTIKPASVGGVAGGEKYMVGGILFKFAVDANGLFNGDDSLAAKVAGHDLKGLVSYYNCDITGLSVPMMLLLDHKGYRLVASTLVPISKESLVYGSDDAGGRIKDADPDLKEKLMKAAKILNLRPHLVSPLERRYPVPDVMHHSHSFPTLHTLNISENSNVPHLHFTPKIIPSYSEDNLVGLYSKVAGYGNYMDNNNNNNNNNNNTNDNNNNLTPSINYIEDTATSPPPSNPQIPLRGSYVQEDDSSITPPITPTRPISLSETIPRIRETLPKISFIESAIQSNDSNTNNNNNNNNNKNDHNCSVVVPDDENPASQFLVCSPVDLEGHKGRDGRHYILDFSRTFPPEAPQKKVFMSHLYRLLRPEFVISYILPLSSDGFSRFVIGQPDSIENNERLRDATFYLTNTIVPEFSKKLAKSLGSSWAGPFRNTLSSHSVSPGYVLTSYTHRAGINMRYLGAITSILLSLSIEQYPFARDAAVLCMIEIVARCVKRHMRAIMRSQMKTMTTIQEWPLRQQIVYYLGLVMSEENNTSSAYWQNDLCNLTKSYFSISIPELLAERGGVHDQWAIKRYMTSYSHPKHFGDGRAHLLARIIELTGLKFTKRIKTLFKAPPAGFFDRWRGDLIEEFDLKDVGTRVKHMNIIDHAKGYILRIKSLESKLVPKRKQLLSESLTRFESALASNPNNKYTLRNYAQALSTLEYLEERERRQPDSAQPVISSFHMNPRLELSASLFKHSLRVDPSDTLSMTHYSNFLLKNSRPRCAFVIALQSVIHHPNHAPSLYQLISLCNSLGYQDLVHLLETHFSFLK